MQEMGMDSSQPNTMSEEEKKNLEELKNDRATPADKDSETMHAFASQLTQVKNDLRINRSIVANLFKEVEEFHEVQSKMLDEEKREMGVIAATRLQAT